MEESGGASTTSTPGLPHSVSCASRSGSRSSYAAMVSGIWRLRPRSMIAEKARGEKVRPAARMGRHGGGPLPILGRVLRDRGMITERQLEEGIQHQVVYGGRLGTSLLQLGFITEERLMEALARANGVPAADLKGIQPEAVAAR